MKINKKSWIEIILLLVLAIIMVVIINKGTLNNFINPRMNKYIYASFPVLILFIIFGKSRKEKEDNKKKFSVFGIFLVLLIILGIIGSNGILSDNMTKDKVTSIRRYSSSISN